MISLRRMSLGTGYRYLMESVAVADGPAEKSSDLTRYYTESGTPPGIFLGAGLAGLDDGRGVAIGSEVTEDALFNLLGMCADPVTGKALGRSPNRAHLSLSKRIAERVGTIPPGAVNRAEQVAQIEAEERKKTKTFRSPVAGFDLTFSPSKSVSVAWALADEETKSAIARCHRRAIDVVLAYAEREVFHSRSGTDGVVQEDIEGVVAVAFTHFDSRAGDPQLHDHVVVANRARSVSDGAWRTLDSRGLFKSVVTLSELHQGVLSDLLTEALGWGWDGRSRRHTERLRYEVTGVRDALMTEFSRRAAAIEERNDALVREFVTACGRRPTDAEMLDLRRRATLDTRPAKVHRSLTELAGEWRERAAPYVGDDGGSWVAELAGRNDLPLLRAADLADAIVADVASVALERVAERRATFSRANVLAEVHRQLHGVRFATPDERIAVAEHSADLALEQALVVEQIATSGRVLDVLVGPAGTGKSMTMAGLRATWEAEHGPGSVLGLAPSAAAAEALADELGTPTENTAKWLHEHRREPDRVARIIELRRTLGARSTPLRQRGILRSEIARTQREVAAWQLFPGQLVIVDEASLAATTALDELVTAATDAGAKVLLVGDDAQLSAVEAGGMFAALVHDREGLAPALSDVRRFHHDWEKEASIELRSGSEDAIDAYESHGRIVSGEREQLLDALYQAWKADTEAGRSSLMIAGDLGAVSELNARARADRVAAGEVTEHGVGVAGGGTAGIGDRVVTRQNNRLLSTGTRWVRNGDRWTVTATHDDGSMTVSRLRGGGVVTLPADYVSEHVELAYASTAHRAQGRTVDTAHALVAPSTTREVLYVSATRGRESNRLYVDTHYDPDPATGHDRATEVVTAKEVLAGVLRNEGAELAAHEMLRRAHDEAEGMERLAAEYTTLATAAQGQRWDALLTRSGLTGTELEAVRASPAHGPLLAAFRDAEARGLDVEAAFPRLVTSRPLAGAEDVASVLHARVDHWMEATGGRRRGPEHLVVGLIPRAQRITDPEMARALAERHLAMEDRARALAEQAILGGQAWVRPLGHPPPQAARREQWLRQVATVAAYRDRWHVTGSEVAGHAPDVGSTEQLVQLRRAQSAARQAVTLSRPEVARTAGPTPGLTVEPYRGIER